MPDPKLAFDRRGVHWTFDPISYLSFVKQLREPISDTSQVIKAPSFDHALKDPSPEAIHILPSHRIVVIEGLYVLLSEEGWKEAAELLDERWLVDVNVEEARRRLVKRHVVTGVASDEKEACWRADNNDMPSKYLQRLRHEHVINCFRWYLLVGEYDLANRAYTERRRPSLSLLRKYSKCCSYHFPNAVCITHCQQ
jgi:pantothenate kinase